MIRKGPIPRNLTVDGFFCKISYYGQTPECDICHDKGHVAHDCPLKGKCRQCLQPGHLQRDCLNPWDPAPPADSPESSASQATQDETSGSSVASDSSSSDDVDSVSFSPRPCFSPPDSVDVIVNVAQPCVGDDSALQKSEDSDENLVKLRLNDDNVTRQRANDVVKVTQKVWRCW